LEDGSGGDMARPSWGSRCSPGCRWSRPVRAEQILDVNRIKVQVPLGPSAHHRRSTPGGRCRSEAGGQLFGRNCQGVGHSLSAPRTRRELMSDRHRDPLAATVTGVDACHLVRVVRLRHFDSSPVAAPPERPREATPSTSQRRCCVRANADPPSTREPQVDAPGGWLGAHKQNLTIRAAVPASRNAARWLRIGSFYCG